VTSDEPFRPRLHFTAKAGWINDPNGLIKIDDEWHLFYQHEPHSTVHGPMHWGHASSHDLVHWNEHPVALYPDALGTCFSGSAVETQSGDIKLLYTAHRTDDQGQDLQVQCLVHADRQLTSFERESSNPIVTNPGLAAFRDPKVFWHGPTRRWIMVLTHGQSVGIRSSSDLVDWRFESEFGASEGRHGEGPWECPDLFQLRTTNGVSRWVLMVGIGTDGPGGGSGTQYFVGEFDGRRFINENAPDVVLWADLGRDYYAAQSFSGASETVTIAWVSNWQYANQTPTRECRGVMSLPRELTLVRMQEGLRLRQRIAPTVAAAFEIVRSGENPTSGTYCLLTQYDPGATKVMSVTLFDEPTPIVTITPLGEGKVRIRTLRESVGQISQFAHDYAVDVVLSGPINIEIFVDNGIVEFGVGGVLWLTNLHFPPKPAGRVEVTFDDEGSPYRAIA
jgi:fructan beta-fructosidase